MSASAANSTLDLKVNLAFVGNSTLPATMYMIPRKLLKQTDFHELSLSCIGFAVLTRVKEKKKALPKVKALFISKISKYDSDYTRVVDLLGKKVAFLYS